MESKPHSPTVPQPPVLMESGSRMDVSQKAAGFPSSESELRLSNGPLEERVLSLSGGEFGEVPKELVTIIWNEYKDQNDWQRHNESQRSAVTTVLLGISGVLIAFLPKDKALSLDLWPIPAFLMGIGILGILVVLKYRERFTRHVMLERAYRELLDLQFAVKDVNVRDESPGLHPPHVLLRVRNAALEKHSTSGVMLSGNRVRLHHLWLSIFVLVLATGAAILLQAILNSNTGS